MIAALAFLGHHWLILVTAFAVIAAVVAAIVLNPAAAALVWRELVGTQAGRELLRWILAALVVLALWWAFAAHYERAGEARQATKDAAAIAGRDKALHAAALALDGASAALQAQNDEADREVLHAKQAEADYNAASAVALQAQDAAQRRMRDFDRSLQDARSHPTCAALLDANLAKACGL